MALQQRLLQKLQQRLSPQQIQLMKLLQVPTASLETRIKEELEENPALELDQYEERTESTDEFESEDSFEEPDGSTDEYDNVNISDYVQDEEDEGGDYKLKDENYPEFSEEKQVPIRSGTSFYDMLSDQLNLLNLEGDQLVIAEQVVGSIDEDGYLRRETSAMVDDLAFRQNVIATEAQVEEVIAMVQQFDPAGVAARNLQECLLLQLKRREDEGLLIQTATAVIRDFFEEFTRKHYERIQKGLSISDEGLREVIQLITRLNPRPGGQVDDGKELNYVVPDFFIYNNAGKLELTLNSRNAPELRISEGYRDMLRDYEKGSKTDKRQKEAVIFIKQKIDAAKWFIDAIHQRQHTLLITMRAILEHQRAFFMGGDETELRPMILKDIAAATGLDISTVSRVANSKYVQTEFGTFRLKYFFNEALNTESGEEVSTREVKKILSDLISGEDKRNPLSDEQLTDLLQEKGYEIARRTVAKYREQLNISVARLRKEL